MVKRIIILVGGLLSIILIALYFSYDYWIEQKLRSSLSELINNNSSSPYQYSFTNFNLDLLEGSVALKNIEILPKPWAYDSLKSDLSNVRFLLEIKLAEIELDNFKIMEFLKTRKIRVETLILTNPEITYLFQHSKSKSSQNMPLSEVFSDKFASARLAHFVVKDAKLIIDNYQSPEPALSINEINLELSNAYADSATLKRLQIIDYEEITMTAKSIFLDVSDYFSLVSERVIFNAQDQSFLIRDFQIQPKYTQQNFASQFAEQRQWFAVKLEFASIRQFDLEKFVASGELQIGKISIRNPNIALYKDKSKPEPTFKKKLLPVSAIQGLPLKFSIDSLQISDGYLAVSEKSNLSGLESHLSFYNLSGTLTNLTNFAKPLRKSDQMQLSASANLFNKLPANVDMVFDLRSSKDEFIVRGQAGGVDLQVFNPVLEPMMALKVTDGQLHDMNFEFTAMDTLSTGILDMNYTNAKFEILSTDTNTETSKKGLLSFAANTIIKSNNEISKPGYTQGVILARRDLSKDIWPYLWHSVMSGIVSTMAPIKIDRETKKIQKQERQERRNERE